MSYDIYGNPLRRGHCEVHPHVHEEYPCSVCVAESWRRQEAQNPAQCNGNPAYCESAHYLGQTQEKITRLNDEIQALRKDAKAGWKEATIAWEVCASIHRGWAKGKDAVFNTRQADFVRHAGEARAAMDQQT